MTTHAVDIAERRKPDSRIATGRLVFGQMFEDYSIETTVLPVGRILCIASAGDTAFALAARGCDVTAVDLNRAQLRYAADRLAGGPVRTGSADRLLSVGRAVLRMTGWRRADVDAFCDLDDPVEQLAIWRARFDTRGFRAVLGSVLSPASVRTAGFSAFTAGLVVRFDTLMRDRLAAGVAIHSNRDNAFLRRLLTGTPVPTPVPPPSRVRLLLADAVDHLEEVDPGSYDGFSLSNVLDGADTAYADRLRAAVRRAAAPGAVAVYRSFAPTPVVEFDRAARRDRSMLWGSLEVARVGTTR